MVLSKFILITIALGLWLNPHLAPQVRAEKSPTLVFNTTGTLRENNDVYLPYGPTVKEIVSPKTKPNTQLSKPRVKNSEPPVSNRRDYTRKTGFAKGQCTDYVAQKVAVTWRGNANRWVANASAQGYQVDRTPAAGSILVTNESRYGHVAYIESANGDNFTISEWNYAGRYRKTTRTLSANDPRIVGVIHLN